MKRSLTILLAMLFCVTIPSIASADHKDEAQKVLSGVAKSFNDRNPEFYNSWTEDAVLSSASGDNAEGREDIQKLFEAKFNKTKAHISSIEVSNAQKLQDNIVIVNGTVEFIEDTHEPISAKFVGVLVKTDKGWSIKSWTSNEVIVAPSQVTDLGIVVHVVNGTDKELEFSLFIQGKDGKNVRIPETKLIAPGKNQGWILPDEIKLDHKNNVYPIGLIGKAKDGSQVNWGVVEAKTEKAGMIGVERTVMSKSDKDHHRFRHVAIKPVSR